MDGKWQKEGQEADRSKSKAHGTGRAGCQQDGAADDVSQMWIPSHAPLHIPQILCAPVA